MSVWAKTWAAIKKVVGWVSFVVAVLFGIRTVYGLRRPGASSGLVPDIRAGLDGVAGRVDAAIDANSTATGAVANGAAAVVDSLVVVDQLDASVERSQSILDRIRGRRKPPNPPA